MHRIDTVGAVGGAFVDASPAGVGGTRLDAAWANSQQETLATLIEAAGITLTKGDNAQLADALNALFGYNVKTFGAKGNAGTDDTAAVQACIDAAEAAGGGRVIFPKGTYYVTGLTVQNVTALHLMGAGRQETFITLTQAASTLLAMTGSNWCTITGIHFIAYGAAQSLAGATGITLDSTCGNLLMKDCVVQGFSSGGMKVNGDIVTRVSGVCVEECYFLHNGGNQFYMLYSSDFHILNNQFGVGAGITPAAIGCFLDKCSTGNYEGNMHWENTIGFKAFQCHYNRIIGNRFERSGHEGMYYDQGVAVVFIGNTIYGNSGDSANTYDNAFFTGMSRCTISNNVSFYLPGDTPEHRWGFNFETSAYSTITNNICYNGFDAVNAGPIRLDSACNNCTLDRQFTGRTVATVAAGSTVYLGGSDAQTTDVSTAWLADGPLCIEEIYIAVSVAPGAAQTFTYTLNVDGVDKAMTDVITGAGTFFVKITAPSPGITVPEHGRFSIKLVTSGGAGAAKHRYLIKAARF